MRRLFNKILKLRKRVVKEARKFTADVIAYIPASNLTITDREKRKKSIEAKREKKRLKREAKEATVLVNSY